MVFLITFLLLLLSVPLVFFFCNQKRLGEPSNEFFGTKSQVFPKISFEGSPKGGLAVNYPPSLIETRKEPLTTVLLSHPFNWRETNHPVGEFCRWCRVIYCPDFHCSSPPRPIYCLNYHSGPRIIYSTVPDNAGRDFLLSKVSRKTAKISWL